MSIIDTIFSILDKILFGLDKAGLPASLCCVGPVAMLLFFWELISGSIRKEMNEETPSED